MTSSKSFVLAFAVILSIALTACGKKDRLPGPTADSPSAAPVQTQQQPKQVQKPKVEDKEEGSLVAKIPRKGDGSSDEPKIEVDNSNVIVDPSSAPSSQFIWKQGSK